ncbi:MAG: nucleotidyl transferase AbiEii/AbiGii toxin family protein [Anaerolineae bacterium]|nr:nucleotidyl transferase AbiEii/AbiGii toxin family protein [Anaerolineae bacterium]
MKDYLFELIGATDSTLQGVNLTREYLQAQILTSLQRAGAMAPLAFHGGTSLRFLFRLPRYSEDLDFALELPNDTYDFRSYLRTVRRDFERAGYDVELKVNDRKTVNSAFVRFPGLLFDLDLSPHRSQVLAVKIEVDTNPPAGAGLATTLIRRYMTLQLHHHDRSSLLAGKLHALLQRPYVKGRDVYDLFWYLSDPDWPAPNLAMLNNALSQTGWNKPALTDDTWHDAILTRLRAMQWNQVRSDVEPFLEPGADLHLFTAENLNRLLTSAN